MTLTFNEDGGWLGSKHFQDVEVWEWLIVDAFGRFAVGQQKGLSHLTLLSSTGQEYILSSLDSDAIQGLLGIFQLFRETADRYDAQVEAGEYPGDGPPIA